MVKCRDVGGNLIEGGDGTGQIAAFGELPRQPECRTHHAVVGPPHRPVVLLGERSPLVGVGALPVLQNQFGGGGQRKFGSRLPGHRLQYGFETGERRLIVAVDERRESGVPVDAPVPTHLSLHVAEEFGGGGGVTEIEVGLDLGEREFPGERHVQISDDPFDTVLARVPNGIQRLLRLAVHRGGQERGVGIGRVDQGYRQRLRHGLRIEILVPFDAVDVHVGLLDGLVRAESRSLLAEHGRQSGMLLAGLLREDLPQHRRELTRHLLGRRETPARVGVGGAQQESVEELVFREERRLLGGRDPVEVPALSDGMSSVRTARVRPTV